jgi:hypothetical protein
MRQGCLRADGRIQPANALNPGISQLWEAYGDVILEKMGRKAKISGDFTALGFWENSLYSSHTQHSTLITCTLLDL